MQKLRSIEVKSGKLANTVRKLFVPNSNICKYGIGLNTEGFDGMKEDLSHAT